MVHELSHRLLKRHSMIAPRGDQETAQFVRDVIGAACFSPGAQRSA